MTTWRASAGDILLATADALICSANPQLNLSGGVGGAFAQQCGSNMQEFLHCWLAQSGRRYVEPGQIVVAPPCGSRFKQVVHAVAVDVFYDTSPEVIRTAYENAFAAIGDTGLRTVAATCLACGYGRAPTNMFLEVLSPLLSTSWPNIDSVGFISRDAELIEAVQNEINKSSK